MDPHREKQLLKFLHGLYAPRGAHQLVEFTLRNIPRIVDCHNRGIARYDPARRAILQMNLDTPFTSRAFIEAVRAGGEMAPESFWQMQPQARHPVHVISQMFTRSQWDEHPMYREMFRSEGLVDCLTLEFGDADRRFMFCLHRDRRGFIKQEIETIRLLAPHLEQAFANARLFETAISSLADPAPANHTCAHHLGPAGDASINAILQQNHARWHRLLGHKATLDDFRSWIEHGLNHLACGVLDSALAPFSLKGGNATIHFTLMRNWGGDGHLLIEETKANWQLTPREHEVLHWVRTGKTDREISSILDLSQHTVREHLRRIYRKTGTRNRTAAARLADPSMELTSKGLTPPRPPKPSESS